METGNIIIRLIADMREFVANIDKAEGKVVGFGNSARTMGDRVQSGLKKAQTATIALGAAVAVYGIKSAYDYAEELDKLRTQAGASASEIEYLKTTILKVSTATNTSTKDLADAYLQVEKAGIRGSKATDLVTASAKAAWVTGGKTVDIAKQVIAAQATQIGKGMNYAQISDLIVRANKRHMGSLTSLFSVMSGPVGTALAANNVGMAQAAAISNIAAKAGITNTRTLRSLAGSLTNISNPTKSFAKHLASVGINANKLAEDARKPGGIINVIQDLQDHAKATGISMQTLLTTVFGPGGVGLATVLSKNLAEVKSTVASLQGASGAGLESAFGISQETLKFKMQQLKTDLQNALTSVGLALLPTVDQIATWATKAAAYLQAHPLAQVLFTDAALSLIAGSLVSKILSVFAVSAAGTIGAEIALGIATAFGSFNLLKTMFPNAQGWLLRALGLGETPAFNNPQFKNMAPWMQHLFLAAGIDPSKATATMSPSSLAFLEYKYGIGPTPAYAKRPGETFPQYQKRLHLRVSVH